MFGLTLMLVVFLTTAQLGMHLLLELKAEDQAMSIARSAARVSAAPGTTERREIASGNGSVDISWTRELVEVHVELRGVGVFSVARAETTLRREVP